MDIARFVAYELLQMFSIDMMRDDLSCQLSHTKKKKKHQPAKSKVDLLK